MPRKWKEEEYQYQKQYAKDNLKFVKVGFNSKKQEDMELWDFLEEAEEGKATHLKNLLRKEKEGLKE